jgi:hypothetical protein
MKRRKLVDFEASKHLIELTQLGAEVNQINSKMCYVKFVLGEIKLSYVYNINKKGKYFLERIMPYPIPIREFDDESDVIKIIKFDLKQYKKALEDRPLEKFIEINLAMNEAMRKFEDLFLYYNIEAEKCMPILERIKDIKEDILELKETSERIFFDKEPYNL